MWEIKSSNFIRCLNVLDHVPEKVGLSSSEFFRIQGKKDKVIISVASYVMGEITLDGTGTWPTDKTLYIDRRVFLPFIYKAKEIKNKHRFKFTYKKNQLTVEHGSRTAVFESQKDISGYADLSKVLKEKENVIPVSDELHALLTCGQNCAVSDAIVPHINCVFIDKGNIAIEAFAASEKVFYMGVGNIKGKIGTSIPFPLMLVKLLTEESLEKISWRGKYVVMHFKHGIVWQPVAQEAFTKFPLKHIRKHAKKSESFPVTFTTSSRRFSSLMVRLSYYLQAVRRKDWVVKVVGTKGESNLHLTTSIAGVRFNETIEVSEKLKSNVSVAWPLDILSPIFEFLSAKTKKLGLIARIDDKHGVTYLTVGTHWFTVTSKMEK